MPPSFLSPRGRRNKGLSNNAAVLMPRSCFSGVEHARRVVAPLEARDLPIFDGQPIFRHEHVLKNALGASAVTVCGIGGIYQTEGRRDGLRRFIMSSCLTQ